jgi:hypothetical protein
MLWSLSDQDLLSEHNTYRLRDTGQGLNRVQMCPAVSKCMHSILHRAQQKAGYWVGSSVIHLGDKNVPNALMFIDKVCYDYIVLSSEIVVFFKLTCSFYYSITKYHGF